MTDPDSDRRRPRETLGEERKGVKRPLMVKKAMNRWRLKRNGCEFTVVEICSLPTTLLADLSCLFCFGDDSHRRTARTKSTHLASPPPLDGLRCRRTLSEFQRQSKIRHHMTPCMDLAIQTTASSRLMSDSLRKERLTRHIPSKRHGFEESGRLGPSPTTCMSPTCSGYFPQEGESKVPPPLQSLNMLDSPFSEAHVLHT